MNSPFSEQAPSGVENTALTIILLLCVAILITICAVFTEAMLIIAIVLLGLVFLYIAVLPILKDIWELIKYVFFTKVE